MLSCFLGLIAGSTFCTHETHLAVHSFEQSKAKGYTAWNEFNVADRWWDKGIRSVPSDTRPFPIYRRETSLLLANKWPNSRWQSLASLLWNIYGATFYAKRIKGPLYKNYSRQCSLPLRLLLPLLSRSGWFLGPWARDIARCHDYPDWETATQTLSCKMVW